MSFIKIEHFIYIANKTWRYCSEWSEYSKVFCSIRIGMRRKETYLRTSLKCQIYYFISTKTYCFDYLIIDVYWWMLRWLHINTSNKCYMQNDQIHWNFELAIWYLRNKIRVSVNVRGSEVEKHTRKQEHYFYFINNSVFSLIASPIERRSGSFRRLFRVTPKRFVSKSYM